MCCPSNEGIIVPDHCMLSQIYRFTESQVYLRGAFYSLVGMCARCLEQALMQAAEV